MIEIDTSAEYIDPTLRAAGGGVVEDSKVLCEHPINLGRLERRRRGSRMHPKRR